LWCASLLANLNYFPPPVARGRKDEPAWIPSAAMHRNDKEAVLQRYARKPAVKKSLLNKAHNKMPNPSACWLTLLTTF